MSSGGVRHASVIGGKSPQVGPHQPRRGEMNRIEAPPLAARNQRRTAIERIAAKHYLLKEGELATGVPMAAGPPASTARTTSTKAIALVTS
jgi:hypothetical protein